MTITLDKALNLLVGMLKADPSLVCEELHEHPKEEEYCANNCQNLTKDCIIRYLKYYKEQNP